MKKAFVLICMVGLFVVFSALKASADEMYRVFEEFEVVTAVVPEGVELTMVPASAGTEGDGFLVVLQGKEYFLPGGQPLTLNAGYYYALQVSRAFQKSDGSIIVMTASTKNVKVGHNSDPSNSSSIVSLYLAEMPEYRVVSPPILKANMAYGMFAVTPIGVWNAVEIVYSDSQRTTTSWYVPKELTINSRIPKNRGDAVVAVSVVIFDPGNGRMFPTKPVSISFNSSWGMAK